MTKNKNYGQSGEAGIVKPSTGTFLSGTVKIKMTGEAKGEVLIVDLEDYFERLNRQGWGCVKRERL